MDSNLEVFNSYNNALASGDISSVFKVLDDNIRWHQPGENIASGTKIGKEVLEKHLSIFPQKTNGTFKVVTNWVSENNDLVAANVTFLGTRADGEELNMNGIDLFRINNGKIVEVWLFSEKQSVEDGFWGKD